MFHSVPGVPRAKMERFACMVAQTRASLNVVKEEFGVR